VCIRLVFVTTHVSENVKFTWDVDRLEIRQHVSRAQKSICYVSRISMKLTKDFRSSGMLCKVD